MQAIHCIDWLFTKKIIYATILTGGREKRQKINIGDTIIFQKEPELEITMKVKVIGLLRYNTFEELFEDFDIEMLADKSMTKQELLNVLEEFYTPEKQKQYGVVGIRIERI